MCILYMYAYYIGMLIIHYYYYLSSLAIIQFELLSLSFCVSLPPLLLRT